MNNKLEEYKEIGANIRQYVNLRFAQMTVFVAITGALISALLHEQVKPAIISIIAFKIGGVIVTALFAIMEQSAVRHWIHFKKRAVKLEKSLKFHQFTQRPHKCCCNATNAVRVFYASVMLFWLYLIFCCSAC